MDGERAPPPACHLSSGDLVDVGEGSQFGVRGSKCTPFMGRFCGVDPNNPFLYLVKDIALSQRGKPRAVPRLPHVPPTTFTINSTITLCHVVVAGPLGCRLPLQESGDH